MQGCTAKWDIPFLELEELQQLREIRNLHLWSFMINGSDIRDVHTQSVALERVCQQEPKMQRWGWV